MITLTLCPVIEGVDDPKSLKLKLHVTFSWLDLDGPDQRDPQAGTRWAQLFHKENVCLSLWHWASLTNSNCCEFQIRSVCPHVFSRLSFPKLYLQSQWVSEEERYSATFVLLTVTVLSPHGRCSFTFRQPFSCFFALTTALQTNVFPYKEKHECGSMQIASKTHEPVDLEWLIKLAMFHKSSGRFVWAGK